VKTYKMMLVFELCNEYEVVLKHPITSVVICVTNTQTHHIHTHTHEQQQTSWNKIDYQSIKHAILLWKRRLAAVTKHDGGPTQRNFSWMLVKAANDRHYSLWFSALWHVALHYSLLKCIFILTYFGLSVL